MTLDDLFHQHALAAYDKRIYLSAMHGKHAWELRVDLGTLAFIGPHDAREEYAVQFLGTASDTQQSWRWAWANEAMFGNPAHLACARDLHALGNQETIAELQSPQHQLDGFALIQSPAFPDRLALIASGICHAGSHFRATYPDGALYMLIKDARFKRPVQRPLARIARIVPMFFSDHHASDPVRAFAHYLEFYRLEPVVQQVDGSIRVTARPRASRDAIQLERSNLMAEFDADGRFRRIAMTD